MTESCTLRRRLQRTYSRPIHLQREMNALNLQSFGKLKPLGCLACGLKGCWHRSASVSIHGEVVSPRRRAPFLRLRSDDRGPRSPLGDQYNRAQHSRVNSYLNPLDARARITYLPLSPAIPSSLPCSLFPFSSPPSGPPRLRKTSASPDLGGCVLAYPVCAMA
jgi:hypothetical protein